MPEGPSILILRERLVPFIGRTVQDAAGRAALDFGRLRSRRLQDIRSWGKHLLLAFDGFSLRIHLLLFGSCLIHDRKDGDGEDTATPTPTVSLRFAGGGGIDFKAASARWIEGDLDAAYDWSADVLSPHWDPQAAQAKLRARPGELACDILLDQSIFSGVGNIIKNEVLFRALVHPLSHIGALPDTHVSQLVAQARDYSFDFLEWKRRNVLKRHWQVHERTTCPRCRHALAPVRRIGKRRRRSFHCGRCQRLYGTPAPG
ncbi:MAG: endonuclease [Lysobacter sp.]|nr:endonuclease [Lysobacter sp.]